MDVFDANYNQLACPNCKGTDTFEFSLAAHLKCVFRCSSCGELSVRKSDKCDMCRNVKCLGLPLLVKCEETKE